MTTSRSLYALCAGWNEMRQHWISSCQTVSVQTPPQTEYFMLDYLRKKKYIFCEPQLVFSPAPLRWKHLTVCCSCPSSSFSLPEPFCRCPPPRNCRFHLQVLALPTWAWFSHCMGGASMSTSPTVPTKRMGTRHLNPLCFLLNGHSRWKC